MLAVTVAGFKRGCRKASEDFYAFTHSVQTIKMQKDNKHKIMITYYL